MKAVIPYKKASAKSRLSSILSQEEREEFVEIMLNQVIDSVREAGIENIDILSPSMYGLENMMMARVLLDKSDLNEALNRYLGQAKEPTLIAMADLPLLFPKTYKSDNFNKRGCMYTCRKGRGDKYPFCQDTFTLQGQVLWLKLSDTLLDRYRSRAEYRNI